MHSGCAASCRESAFASVVVRTSWRGVRAACGGRLGAKAASLGLAAVASRKDVILKRGWQVVLVLMSVGCAGELRDPDRFAFLFDDDNVDAGPTGDAATGGTDAAPMPPSNEPPACVTALFKKSCALTGCHAANAQQVDLASAGVSSRLVGKASTTMTCRSRVFIATDGSDSLLMQKLEDDPPCGAKMPIGPALSAAETTCLTDWVESFAE